MSIVANHTTEVLPTKPPLTDDSVSGLVSGIITDVQTLVRQEGQMLRAELRNDLHQSKLAAEFGAMGIICISVGCLGAFAALASLFHEQFEFALWLSLGIVSGLFLLGGFAFGRACHDMLRRLSPISEKASGSLPDDTK